MAKFFKRVNGVFDRFPFISQGVVSSVIQGAGDVIAQKFVEDTDELDKKRTMHFMAVGFCTGVLLRKWFGVLQKNFDYPKPFANAVFKVTGELKFLLKVQLKPRQLPQPIKYFSLPPCCCFQPL